MTFHGDLEFHIPTELWGFPGGSEGKKKKKKKNLLVMQKTWVGSLVWDDPLEKGMAIHYSILSWRIPWTEKPGGLQFMRSQRVRRD